MAESTADQNRIEHDLERTRSRMDSRLDELQDRLSPGQVIDDLMKYFRGSESGDFARNLMVSVRSNPLPAALTGIGLAWLIASNPPLSKATSSTRAGSGRGRAFTAPGGLTMTSHEELDRHMRKAEQNVVRNEAEADAAYRRRVDEARGKALGVARQTEDTQEAFGKRVQDAWAAAKQSVTEVAHDLGDRASDATHQLSGTAQGAGNQLAHGAQVVQHKAGSLLSTIADNPVLLGTISLAVGALLGALVPQSEQEEAALGEMAGQARGAARNLAQEVVDRGGEVAQQALEAGQDSAQAHGLTGNKTMGDLANEVRNGDLASNVKQVAQDILKAGDDAFRKEGLSEGQDAAKPSSSSRPGSTASSSRPGSTASPEPEGGKR